MSNENALDRLNKLQEPSKEREYTLEEQMDSVSTDEFLDGMSLAAKSQINHFFEETAVDVEQTDDETDLADNNQEDKNATTNNNEDDVNNVKPKRKYNKRNNVEERNQSNTSSNNDLNPVFDQIAKDLIDTLKNKNFKIHRFDDKSMAVIYDYMYNKF